MRVLIACERSGTVRDALAARGVDAWSCDVVASERAGQHLRCDVRDVLGDGWDMMIAHPDCTFLASSGLHWNKRRPGRAQSTEGALAFVRTLLDAPIPRIALENPVGCISTRVRPYDQKVQPWQYGDDASKGTCLWLKGLPKLTPTRIIPPRGWQRAVGPRSDDATRRVIDGVEFATRLQPAPHPVWSNQTPSGQNKLGPSPDRAALRARTYAGIAAAMADQWVTA